MCNPGKLVKCKVRMEWELKLELEHNCLLQKHPRSIAQQHSLCSPGQQSNY
jgi:hypothetical protein